MNLDLAPMNVDTYVATFHADGALVICRGECEEGAYASSQHRGGLDRRRSAFVSRRN
jgi:hypothetical protein